MNTLNYPMTPTEALEFLREISQLKDDKYSFFFRGENRFFEQSVPSIFRKKTTFTGSAHTFQAHLGYEPDYLYKKSYLSSFALAFFEYFTDLAFCMGPADKLHHLESKLHITDYYGYWSEGVSRHHESSFQSMLQHYGWPTYWLDITPDPEVAIFFAYHDFSSNHILTDGEGYIHYWDLREMLISNELNRGNNVVMDLSTLGEILSIVFKSPHNRPKNQKAFAIKLESDWDIQQLNKFKKTIIVKRSPKDGVINKDYIYPVDEVFCHIKCVESLHYDYLTKHNTNEEYLKFVDFFIKNYSPVVDEDSKFIVADNMENFNKVSRLIVLMQKYLESDDMPQLKDLKGFPKLWWMEQEGQK